MLPSTFFEILPKLKSVEGVEVLYQLYADSCYDNVEWVVCEFRRPDFEKRVKDRIEAIGNPPDEIWFSQRYGRYFKVESVPIAPKYFY